MDTERLLIRKRIGTRSVFMQPVICERTSDDLMPIEMCRYAAAPGYPKDSLRRNTTEMPFGCFCAHAAIARRSSGLHLSFTKKY